MLGAAVRTRAWLVLPLAALACGGETQPAATPAAPKAAAPTPASETPAASTGEPVEAPATGCPQDMAAIDGGKLWRKPPVDVVAYCLDRREVTIAEYTACVQNGICDAPPRDVQLLEPSRQQEHEQRSRGCTARLAENSSLPVNCVGFDDAGKYCAWKGRRLPSEIEWEWAATGGDDKLDFPWGSSPPRDDVVCFQAKRPCSAGSKPAEAFGLFDLGGNVSEWTTAADGDAAIRGGSYADGDAAALAPTRRQSAEPLFRDINVGFRCAKDL